MNEWFLYWVLRLDTLHALFVSGGILSGTIILMLTLAYTLEAPINCMEWLKRSAVAFLAFVLLTTFTPSTKDAFIIYGVPALLRNQAHAVQKMEALPEKVVDALTQKLDEIIGKEKDIPNEK